MINKSEKFLTEQGLTIKDLSNLLGMSTTQIRNILKGENKSLYNFLAISYISEIPLQQMFRLTKEEKEELKNRFELIKKLK